MFFKRFLHWEIWFSTFFILNFELEALIGMGFALPPMLHLRGPYLDEPWSECMAVIGMIYNKNRIWSCPMKHFSCAYWCDRSAPVPSRTVRSRLNTLASRTDVHCRPRKFRSTMRKLTLRAKASLPHTFHGLHSPKTGMILYDLRKRSIEGEASLPAWRRKE